MHSDGWELPPHGGVDARVQQVAVALADPARQNPLGVCRSGACGNSRVQNFTLAEKRDANQIALNVPSTRMYVKERGNQYVR